MTLPNEGYAFRLRPQHRVNLCDVNQTYDALLAYRLDRSLISEQSSRLAQDRQKWAQQQQELIQRRMEAFRRATVVQGPRDPPTSPITPVQPTVPSSKATKPKAAAPLKSPAVTKTPTKPATPKSPPTPRTPVQPTVENPPAPKLRKLEVSDILKELMNATPELAARKEAILKVS